MIRIGKIVATHGLQGAVIMTHIVGDSKWLNKNTALFVEMQKGSFIPYFTQQVKANNNEEYHLNFEDINTIEAAKRLVGRQVYADEKLLGSYAKQSPLLWIGFEIIDSILGNIGKIEDIMLTANQWLATTTINDTEVLIPLIDQTINEIDINKKIIKVTLPEGLLDVYLRSEQ